eukprot:gene2678-1676_t
MPNTQITHQHYAIHTNIINYTNITVLHSPHRVLQPNNYTTLSELTYRVNQQKWNKLHPTQFIKVKQHKVRTQHLHNVTFWQTQTFDSTNNPSVQTNLGCTYTHKSTTSQCNTKKTTHSCPANQNNQPTTYHQQQSQAIPHIPQRINMALNNTEPIIIISCELTQLTHVTTHSNHTPKVNNYRDYW